MFGRSHPPSFRNTTLCCVVYDARFAKQRGCRIRKFVKVHVTHHILERLNILHIQMTKVTIPKLKPCISYWRLHQDGRIHFVHLHKIYLVEVFSGGAIAMASSLQDLTMHLFRVNWAFKALITSLFTENKLTCNLDTTMNLIFDNTIITQMHIMGTITTYVSNVTLR